MVDALWYTISSQTAVPSGAGDSGTTTVSVDVGFCGVVKSSPESVTDACSVVPMVTLFTEKRRETISVVPCETTVFSVVVIRRMIATDCDTSVGMVVSGKTMFTRALS